MIIFHLGFLYFEHFLHFYFLNMDISFDIQVTEMTSLAGVKNIKMEGKVSQNFNLGLGFDFMKKKRVTFVHFLKLDFLDFINKN